MSTTKPFWLIGSFILRSLNLLRSPFTPLLQKQGVARKASSQSATKSLTAQRVSRLAEPNLFCHVTVSVRIRDKELEVFPFFFSPPLASQCNNCYSIQFLSFGHTGEHDLFPKRAQRDIRGSNRSKRNAYVWQVSLSVAAAFGQFPIAT